MQQSARRVALGATLGFCAFGIGCGDKTDAPLSPSIHTPPIADAVTPELLAQLRPDGTFDVTIAALAGEIGSEQATALAWAWVADYAAFNRSLFEREHGARVDVATLTPCGAPTYTATPYVDVPNAPAYVRNVMGPYWLVAFCAPNGVVQVSIGVAARTENTVANGHVAYHGVYGNDFRVMGVPLGAVVPVSAERAAALAFVLTGRRVSGVPELVRQEWQIFPQNARWRVPLEAPVGGTGLSSHRELIVAEVFIGYGGSRNKEVIETPVASQPTEAVWRVAMPDQEFRTQELRVPVAPGRAVLFEGFVPRLPGG